MAHFKFIGHQLIGVLAMGLAEFFVQHNAVADGEASVHAIDKLWKAIMKMSFVIF